MFWGGFITRTAIGRCQSNSCRHNTLQTKVPLPSWPNARIVAAWLGTRFNAAALVIILHNRAIQKTDRPQLLANPPALSSALWACAFLAATAVQASTTASQWLWSTDCNVAVTISTCSGASPAAVAACASRAAAVLGAAVTASTAATAATVAAASALSRPTEAEASSTAAATFGAEGKVLVMVVARKAPTAAMSWGSQGADHKDIKIEMMTMAWVQFDLALELYKCF